jgi:hypothetical protein
VYDGQIETNDLEAIWTKFNTRLPPGYTGHSLSMSDVIELYDHTGSEYHYVDRFGFKEIGFEGRPEQTQCRPGLASRCAGSADPDKPRMDWEPSVTL